MYVAVMGLGYVGCVTAACLADAGHQVIGIDPAADKVAAINDGRAPIVEPGLGELVSKNRAVGRMSASTQIDAMDWVDVAIVCVGTPSAASGELNLDYVKAVAQQIAARLSHREDSLTIMLRSTSLPGTTRTQFIPWIEEASGMTEGSDFHVVFCPEFLRESTALADFYNPPFTVIGVESESAAERPAELLSFLGSPPEIVTTGVAEALKYGCNAFHAVKVAFANEIARLCSSADIDPRTVMELFVQDRELNISPRYLRPGFAFGGSCLPKDVKALQHFALAADIDSPLIQSLTMSNDAYINEVADAVIASGAKTVAQVGLTFKPATDDLRESPYVKLAARLRAAHIKIQAYDPIIKLDRLVGANLAYVQSFLPDIDSILVDDMNQCLSGADLILLGNNQADVCEEILNGPTIPVFDLTGMLPPRIERALREREPNASLATSAPGYVGAAW